MTQPFIRTPEDAIAIRASNLQKTYAGTVPKTALHDVSLDIPVGCIFGLLGPNGAGKSTFINILAGTVVKTGGMVSVWGTDIDGNPRQARANIGIVPQELNIDAYFTPRETLEMQAGLFGVPASERRSDALLELVGLSEQAHTYARRLSGGMRRRLLVAKAMVHSPPVLVLDEPTAGVDVALRQQLWDITIVIRGGYWETTKEGKFWRRPGYIGFRSANTYHRVDLEPGTRPMTIFISGPFGLRKGPRSEYGIDFKSKKN